MKVPVMRADGLCKSFAIGGIQNHVLDRISTELYDGDFTVVIDRKSVV